MNHKFTTDEIALALNADQQEPDPEGVFSTREMLMTVIRYALLMDVRPPPGPHEDGLPDMIQSAIQVGENVIHHVNYRGTSQSSPRQLQLAAFAPLSLLAGALLRSQGVDIEEKELETARRECQVLNSLLWGR
jgi:hypothetical protein